jgi:hypothetical protein
MLTALPAGRAADAWSSLSKEPHTGGEYVMAYLRLAGLPGFIHALSRYPQENLPVAIWFAASELAPIVARAFHKLKTLREGRASGCWPIRSTPLPACCPQPLVKRAKRRTVRAWPYAC